MGISITCDKCSKETDDVTCASCVEKTGLGEDLAQAALHDLALAIARQRDPAEVFMALDVLIRDCANADDLRERIAIARAAA